MRFLSNCILVQAHTQMIQRRDRNARTYIAPLYIRKPFRI